MEAKFLASALSFLSIFLAIHAQSNDKLVPNYDNVEHQMKFYDIRTPLVLSCNVRDADPTAPLIWKKNGTAVTEVASLRGRFKLIDAERKFIIDRSESHDDGLYSCEIDGESKNINVIARVVVRVPSNTAVVEGEKMSVTCTVLGTKPQLSWTFGNITLTNATDRFVLKEDNGVPNSILTLENVTLDDRGEYKCFGRNAANEYGVNSTVVYDTTTVRVKGKFAALWPFLGICAEVLILCVIILIYEKRRNKSELEESDTDPQEHLSPLLILLCIKNFNDFDSLYLVSKKILCYC
ncbi:basigin isoform X1 [Drosophila kikkawai]|uniref:Basigin isoform X1 n=2 Tax=Drosophila kikkawai TaxID=30033 RepID=A0ABM3C6C5_DROKI